MEKLFRTGHEASLTLGNAKNIDIFTKSPAGNLYEVSVKAIRGGGKWGIGKTDYSRHKQLVFVLLHYLDFDDVSVNPEIWIIPAQEAEKVKQPWFENYGIYCSNKEHRSNIEKFKNAWQHLA